MLTININQADNAMPIVDVFTLVLSVLAIIVSIWSAIASYHQMQRGQRISLEADYFSDIFKDYLLNRIPNAWRKITFSDGEIIQDDDLTNVLVELGKKSQYFMFSDNDFYLELKEKLQGIEDDLVNAHNYNYSKRQQESFKKKISRQLHDMYHFINKKYYGI